MECLIIAMYWLICIAFLIIGSGTRSWLNSWNVGFLNPKTFTPGAVITAHPHLLSNDGDDYAFWTPPNHAFKLLIKPPRLSPVLILNAVFILRRFITHLIKFVLTVVGVSTIQVTALPFPCLAHCIQFPGSLSPLPSLLFRFFLWSWGLMGNGVQWCLGTQAHFVLECRSSCDVVNFPIRNNVN